MPTQKKAADPAPAYDPAKRYSVKLARAVEFEGFTLKPPNLVEMSGAWANDHADAIAEAQELPELPPHPEAQPEVHEIAER